MATIIYKDGKSASVEYNALKRHLDAGWSTSKEPAPAAEEKPKPKPKRRATRKKVVKDDE